MARQGSRSTAGSPRNGRWRSFHARRAREAGKGWVMAADALRASLRAELDGSSVGLRLQWR
jgi:hypothetical protein